MTRRKKFQQLKRRELLNALKQQEEPQATPGKAGNYLSALTSTTAIAVFVFRKLLVKYA
jgi:hypothetical protein